MWTQAWSERISPTIEEYPNSKEELVKMIAKDEEFTLYDNYFSILTYPEYKNCLIIDVPQPYDPKVFAYAFTKGSPYLPLFNHYLNMLRESGVISQITERYVSLEAPQCEETSGTALGFDNCFTAFVILMGGILLSFLFFLLEMADRGRRCLAHFHDDERLWDPSGKSKRFSFDDEPGFQKEMMPNPKLIFSIEQKDSRIRALEREVHALQSELRLRVKRVSLFS